MTFKVEDKLKSSNVSARTSRHGDATFCCPDVARMTDS